MAQITVKADGTLSHLVRAQARPELLLQVNDKTAVQNGLADVVGNENTVPTAQADTGILGSTRIATPDGPVAVQNLKPGDLVNDAQGNAVAVMHILKTQLTKTGVCVHAPYFGLDQDLITGTDQRISITSDIAEYLFGTDTVLVPMWALKDNRKARHWEMDRNTHLCQIQLATAAAIKVGNCTLESMRKQGQPTGKVLSQHEARCFAAEHKSGYQN